MIIIELAMLLIIATIWVLAGYQLLRFIVPQTGMITAVTLGAIVGEASYLFFVNILSYFFQVNKASWIVLGIMLIVGIFFLNHNKKYKHSIFLELEKPLFIFLLIVVGVIFAIYSLNLFFGGQINFDGYYHQPFSATIAEGNFPPRLLMNPDYSSQYHYGIDLLAASLITIADLKPWTTINVLVLYNLVLAFFAAFTAGRILNKNFLSGLFAGILLFFGGSWIYLLKIFSLNTAISDEDLKGQVVSSYGISLYHNPTALAVPVFLAIICIIYYLIKQQAENHLWSRMKYVMVVATASALIATLALIEEEYFLIISAAISFVCLFIIIKNKIKKNILSPILILLIASVIFAELITLLQGGTLTQTIISKEGGQTVNEVMKIKFRADAGISFWGGDASTRFTDFIPLKDPGIIFFLLAQFGPLPFIFPFVCFFLYKNITDEKKDFIYKIMLLAAIFSFLIPAFIEYPISDVNFTRILAIFKHIGNIFIGSAIGILAIKKISYRKYTLPVIFIILVSYLTASILYNLFTITHQFFAGYQWGLNKPPSYIKPQDFLIAEEAKKIVPQNSRVLTTSYIGVPTLWGRFAPFSIGRNDPWIYSPTYLSLFPRPSTQDLKAMKITYIYTSPFQERTIYTNDKAFEFLLNGVDQKYLQDNPQWFSLIKKWDFNNRSYYLYKVINEN